MIISMFDSESMCGYKQITTFWQDFSIADMFGIKAIEDTYKNGLEYAKTDYKVLTEMVMILNWKIWQWHEKNDAIALTYNKLWKKLDYYAVTHLKGDELNYFYTTTD